MFGHLRAAREQAGGRSPRRTSRHLVACLLDRLGDTCLRLGGALYSLREGIEPSGEELTEDASERILAGVHARIAAEPQPHPQAFVRFQGFH